MNCTTLGSSKFFISKSRLVKVPGQIVKKILTLQLVRCWILCPLTDFQGRILHHETLTQTSKHKITKVSMGINNHDVDNCTTANVNNCR